jgi:penicillin amidase
VPHAINPASGYLATANADPVGATFDDNPLNQPVVDGRPLYAGVTYAAGVREERISTLIEQAAAAGPVTLAEMARIQHDASSTVGAKLTPVILAALAKVADPTGAPADVATFVAGLSAADKAALTTAQGLLGSWTFAAPAATDPAATAAELHDAASTALFNTWMHYFIVRALKDELDAAAFDVWRLEDNQLVRIVYALLTNPGDFVASATTGQPILCDGYATAGPDDSCTKVILQAALDAVGYLGSPAGYGSADPTTWRWGLRHRLTIKPLFPNPQLNLPREGESAATAGGFPKAGDNFVINRADQGWSDLSFAQYADGPAQRFLAEATTGQPIKVKWQLPGGVIFDSRSPHYRDLLDKYYLPQTHFDAPFLVPDIVAAGEDHWVFR